MGGNTSEHLRAGMVAAQELAERGEYQRAVNSVKSVKAANPRNIYVLALEKQLEQLLQLASIDQLTEDQKLDILDSLPGIVERALDGQSAEVSGGQTMVLKPLTEEAVRQKEEKSAALEWLKNQYFQHAHDYVRKGEYDNALAEIRRVYIIEPGNRTAQDFEQQILQLGELRRGRPPEKAPAERPPAPPPATPEPPAPKQSRRERTPAPEPVAQEQPKPVPVPPAEAAEKPAKSRMSNWVVAAILFTIVVMGAGIFYFLIRPQLTEKIKYRGTVAPIGGAVFSPPTTSVEQTFVISSDPSEQVSTEPVNQAVDSGTTTTEGQLPDSEPNPVSSNEEHIRLPGTTPEITTTGPPKESTAAGGGMLLASSPASPPPQTSTPAESSTTQEERQTPFVPVEQPAQIVKLERPRFSDIVYRAGLEGQVVVQVQLDTEGRPQTAKVVSSTNSLLEDAVLDAVLRSQFLPARMSTGPVASSLVIPFKFTR